MRTSSSLNSSNTPPGQYRTNETLVQTGRQPSAGTKTASITKAAPAPGHRPETAQNQRATQAWQSSEYQRPWTAVSLPCKALGQQQNNCSSNVYAGVQNGPF